MVKQNKTEEKVVKTKTNKKDYYAAVGRRREAVARVRIFPSKETFNWGEISLKKGDIYINLKSIEEYFPKESEKVVWKEPFRVTNTLGKYITTIKVAGGGRLGQLDAIVHGVARALEQIDKEKFRPILKKKGFLQRDARIRQRRMVGMGGKSRRKRQSPKR